MPEAIRSITMPKVALDAHGQVLILPSSLARPSIGVGT